MNWLSGTKNPSSFPLPSPQHHNDGERKQNCPEKWVNGTRKAHLFTLYTYVRLFPFGFEVVPDLKCEPLLPAWGWVRTDRRIEKKIRHWRLMQTGPSSLLVLQRARERAIAKKGGGDGTKEGFSCHVRREGDRDTVIR